MTALSVPGDDVMNGVGVELITRFYEEVARDLAVYMAAIGLVALLLWGGQFFIRSRFTLGLAAAFLVLGAGLAFAGQSYRGGIPAKIERDIGSLRADATAARRAILRQYGRELAWARFSRLLLLWAGLIAASIIVIALTLVRGTRPGLAGVAAAVILASLLTLILDARAYRRDVDYAELWSMV